LHGQKDIAMLAKRLATCSHLSTTVSKLFETKLPEKILLRTPAFISCVPWGRPCGNHAKRYMNENTIQCFPNPSQHVAIYLEQFLCFEIRKYKKSGFLRTAAHIFACRRPYDCSTLLDNLQMPARFGTSSPH